MMPRTVLDRQMRCVLARLEMVSNGTTVSYNSSGGAVGESDDPRPRGGQDAPHLYWRVRYRLALDDSERAQAIEDAQTEWERLTGRGSSAGRPDGETEDEYRARILADTQGDTPLEVAQSRHAISERTLRKWRRDAGADPETGQALTVDNDSELARHLLEQGKSVRYVAMRTGIPKSTLQGWTTKMNRDERAA